MAELSLRPGEAGPRQRRARQAGTLLWNCSGNAYLWLSQKVAVSERPQTLMGTFSNELIPVLKLITALITCLLQMAHWAQRRQGLAENHSVCRWWGRK